MEPVPFPEPEPGRPGLGAGWLNGTIWAMLVLCCVGMAAGGIGASLLLGPLTGLLVLLGAAANLGCCLWFFVTRRPRLAWPYLLGFLPLAALSCLVVVIVKAGEYSISKPFGSG